MERRQYSEHRCLQMPLMVALTGLLIDRRKCGKLVLDIPELLMLYSLQAVSTDSIGFSFVEVSELSRIRSANSTDCPVRLLRIDDVGWCSDKSSRSSYTKKTKVHWRTRV
jgi:hypothetical protein